MTIWSVRVEQRIERVGGGIMTTPMAKSAIQPTIIVDPSFDLDAAGLRNTPAARASFARAYQRAARRLGFVARVGVSRGDVVADDEGAGLTDEQIAALWQAAHDAICESRSGRWAVRTRAADLRAAGRRIMARP